MTQRGSGKPEIRSWILQLINLSRGRCFFFFSFHRGRKKSFLCQLAFSAVNNSSKRAKLGGPNSEPVCSIFPQSNCVNRKGSPLQRVSCRIHVPGLVSLHPMLPYRRTFNSQQCSSARTCSVPVATDGSQSKEMFPHRHLFHASLFG